MKVQEPVQEQELPRCDGLPRDIAALESLGEHRRETVLLIHGTFANMAGSWWYPGSDFCRKLDLSLSQQGSPARCWAHIGSPTNPKNVFAWTGDNLEAERHIGGDSLAKEITNLEATHDISRYHIVAHSHGGNVVLHALRSLADDPKNLGAVIFLGTPVLLFSLRPSWLTRSAEELFLYGVGLVLSIAAAALGIVSILMAVAFGSLLLVTWLTRPRRRLPTYGSGHAHAFEFASDEAMKALQLSLGFAQRPGDVLEQLFSTKAPPEHVVDPPRPEFWKGLWSLRKRLQSGQFSLPTGSTSPVVQMLTAILSVIFTCFLIFVGILAILNDVFPPFSKFLGSHGSLNLIERLYNLTHAMYSAFYAIAVFILILMFFLSFLSVVIKFVRLSAAWLFHLFLRGPGGAWIMGAVVRNAAVGGQCKMVLRPPELPEKERALRETISDKLNEKMNDLSSMTAARAGEALYSALAEGDAMKLKEHIFARLTNPELAHCQYYREDEIIYRIAELIAPRLHR
jgi:hypothetical protein